MRGCEGGRTRSPGTVSTCDLSNNNVKRERKVGGHGLDFANHRHVAIKLPQITREKNIKQNLNIMGLNMLLSLTYKIPGPIN